MCKKIISGTIILISFISLMSSCSTVQSAKPQVQKNSSTPVYYGAGSGDSALKAMVEAKRNALRQAASDLLGSATEEKSSDLDRVFADIKDFSPYLLKDSQKTVDSSSGEKFYYQLGLKINLDAIAGKLISEDIYGGQISGNADEVYTLEDRPMPKVASAVVESAPVNTAEDKSAAQVVASEVTAEELEIISRYIDGLTYMVYFNEEIVADSAMARSAVVSANRYLDENGYDFIDLARLELILEEQEAVYEEETGKAVSMLQWVAHKLNADIYIELSLDTSSTSDGQLHYGTADISLNCYVASTGEDRGGAAAKTDPAVFSKVSVDAAVSGAVNSVVFKGMKAAVDEAEEQSARAVSHGFKYILTITTTNVEIIDDFEKNLERGSKSVKRISFSPEESVFEVYLIGDIADLEDIVFYAAGRVPGLEGMMLVMQRGKSIIFDTGM
jgi:hypothetical protein